MEDRIHGQGVAVFASGNRYEGTWENGRIHGHGSVPSARLPSCRNMFGRDSRNLDLFQQRPVRWRLATWLMHCDQKVRCSAPEPCDVPDAFRHDGKMHGRGTYRYVGPPVLVEFHTGIDWQIFAHIGTH